MRFDRRCGAPRGLRWRPVDRPPRSGSPGAPLWDPDAVPAATVVVLRDGPDGPEVLMLQRDQGLSFAGGMWVFPGGRIDPEDHPEPGPPDDLEAAARRGRGAGGGRGGRPRDRPRRAAPVVALDAPAARTKRFTTAFFVAPAVGRHRRHGDRRRRDPRPPLGPARRRSSSLRDAGEVEPGPAHLHHPDAAAPAPQRGRGAAPPRAAAEVEHFATRMAWSGTVDRALPRRRRPTRGRARPRRLEGPRPPSGDGASRGPTCGRAVEPTNRDPTRRPSLAWTAAGPATC